VVSSASAKEQPSRPRPSRYPYRGAVAAALAVSLFWLVYVVAAAQRHAPVFRSLFEGLGSPLPLVTRALFASYQWWWVAPLVLAAAAFDVVRRPTPSPRYFAIVLAVTLLLAATLHAWLYEAFFQPLIGVLKAID
jgi:hypothetical protein